MAEEIHSKTTIDGVDIITDGDVTHFVITDEEIERLKEKKNKEKEDEEEKSLPWYKRILNWFTKHNAKPYVKIRDLADPFGDRDDFDVGSDGVSGVEGGIKISF